MDCFADARIGTAAAQVAGHRLVDLGVARVGVGVQQGDGLHDLARLAVAALGDLFFDPGRLYGVERFRRADPLDRGHDAAVQIRGPDLA